VCTNNSSVEVEAHRFSVPMFREFYSGGHGKNWTEIFFQISEFVGIMSVIGLLWLAVGHSERLSPI